MLFTEYYYPFIAFLILIAIVGFAFGIHLNVKYTFNAPGCLINSLGGLINGFWLAIPVTFFLSMIFLNEIPAERTFYLGSLGIGLICYTFVASYGATVAERKIEDRFPKKLWIRIILRTVVIAIGAVSISASGSVVKAIAYHSQYARYKISENVVAVSKKELKAERAASLKYFTDYSQCLNDLNRIKESHLWDTDSAISRVKSKYGFTLGFSQTVAEGITFRFVDYSNDAGTSCVLPLYDSIPYEKASLIALRESAFRKKESFRKAIAQIDARPVPITLFAYVQFLELLGNDKLIESADARAKKIDLIILWSSYIFTGLIFYISSGLGTKQSTPTPTEGDNEPESMSKALD